MSICIAQVCLGDKVPLSDSLIWSMMMCHSLEQRAAISLTNNKLSYRLKHYISFV